MPDYQIHADYDHNRRISGHPNEYDLRQTQPGGILLPNLDADNRRRPGYVSDGRPIILDWQRVVKHSSENDLLRFIIRIVRPSVPDDCRFYLRTIGWLGTKMCIYNNRGQQLRHLPTMPNVYPISFTDAQMVLKLEAQTLPGTPLYFPSTLGLRSAPPGYIHEGVIRLELYYFDARDQRTLLDWSYFTIAPIMFIDNTCETERIYISEIQDPNVIGSAILENHPTIADIESALARIGIPLVKVPHSQCQRDGWLQDQFKIGYCHAPNGFMYMVLHSPRMKSNSVDSSAVVSNLAGFVSTYFPSNQIGLFQDFWERRVRFQDADNHSQSLLFRDSQEILLIVKRIYYFRNKLIKTLNRFNPHEAMHRERYVSIGEALIEFPRFIRFVIDEIRNYRGRTTSEQLRNLLDSEVRDIQEQYHNIIHSVSMQGDRIALRITSLNCEITDQELTRLYERLDQMHDGANYGGNMEVSPPVPEAPFGKLVIGNSRIYNRDLVDPELKHFLRKQNLQPLIEIDTHWLQVGHIDELMTFVPSSSEGQDFAILRASPAIAIKILYEAVRLHLQGLRPGRSALTDTELQEYLQNYCPGTLIRRTIRGASPITHMLRGQKWLHHHPQGAYVPLEPPLIYRKMVRYYLRNQFGYQTFPYQPGEGDDRYYSANISILEFLYFEDGTNSDIDELQTDSVFGGESEEDRPFLAIMDSILSREFPDISVIKLPVLFDAVENWIYDTTVAFAPNMVNMQVINGHVIIPRPYGPRMRVQDTISVLRSVFESISASHCISRLNERYFAERDMIYPTIWKRFGTLGGITQEFEDGFPRRSRAEIEQLIREANRRRNPFLRDGGLRPGWHKVIIPEETVDLFEAYTQIIIESIGLQVHWADSWFYHVRLGEIHCGTNVKRQPRIRGRTPWWLEKPPVHYQR